MIYQVGETFRDEFYTYDPLTGELADPDSAATGVLVINGTDQGTTVTITNPSTGVNKVSCSLAGLALNDIGYIRVSATVGGVTENRLLGPFRIDKAAWSVPEDVWSINYEPLGATGNAAEALAAVVGKTAALPASPAAVGSAMTLTSGERNSVADALLDRADAVETGVTFRNALRGVVATLLGKSTNDGNTFRNIGDTKNVITATVDASSNRTAITRDLT